MQVWVGRHTLRQTVRAKVRLAWRLWAPPRPAARAFIGRMGLLITCLTMFGPPVVYAAWSFYGLEQRALHDATVGARHLETQISPQRTTDSLS